MWGVACRLLKPRLKSFGGFCRIMALRWNDQLWMSPIVFCRLQSRRPPAPPYAPHRNYHRPSHSHSYSQADSILFSGQSNSQTTESIGSNNAIQTHSQQSLSGGEDECGLTRYIAHLFCQQLLTPLHDSYRIQLLAWFDYLVDQYFAPRIAL